MDLRTLIEGSDVSRLMDWISGTTEDRFAIPKAVATQSSKKEDGRRN